MPRISAIGICLLFLIIPQHIKAQTDSTGFFIVLDTKKECVNPFKYLAIGTPLCLSKNPIVTLSDFESYSEIHTNELNKFIELKLTANAYARLQLLASKLPKTTLALVIDGIIVGIIENLQVLPNPVPIYSSLRSSDIEWVYGKLKKLKTQNKS